jgi:uncharacterized protein (DUF433 family)
MRGAAVRKSEPLSSHPYVVQTKGVCGGRARIRGSRISVRTIAEYLRSGQSRSDILFLYPHIEPAAIDDAISYYGDHRQEIEAEIEANSLEAVLAETDAVLGADGVIRLSKPTR